MPAGSASTVQGHLRSQVRWSPQAWSRRAYSTLTAMLPRPSAKFLPANAADEIGAGVAICAGAALAADLKALIMVLEDEVDDARDGVRAVNGRVAAGDDVDAVDEVGRDGVDVGATPLPSTSPPTWRRPLTRTSVRSGPKTAKVEQVQARGAEEPGRVGLGERACDRGQLGELVADRDVAGLEEFLTADRRHRQGRIEVRTPDARARDRDRRYSPLGCSLPATAGRRPACILAFRVRVAAGSPVPGPIGPMPGWRRAPPGKQSKG